MVKTIAFVFQPHSRLGLCLFSDMVTIYIFSYLFHIISDIISQIGIYDMILYQLKFWDRRYDIISHFGEKIISYLYLFHPWMSRVKVFDPGEFIASFRPKKILTLLLGLSWQNQVPKLLERGCEFYQIFDYKVQFQDENSVELKK